jgi:hypothetical protein
MRDKTQLLLEETYEQIVLKENPDASFSPSTKKALKYQDGDAMAFGFLDLTGKRELVKWDGKKVGTIEGFGPEWKDLLLLSGAGGTHDNIIRDLLPKIQDSAQGVITLLYDEGLPDVLDLSTNAKQDERLLSHFLYAIRRQANPRIIMSPSGRIWRENKVISFWDSKKDVSPNHLDRLFKKLKIPREQMQDYYIEFLGDRKPKQTVSQYVSNPTSQNNSSKEDREKAILAKGLPHLLGGVAGVGKLKNQDFGSPHQSMKAKKAGYSSYAEYNAKRNPYSESLTMKRTDQQLLEEAYEDIVQYAKKHNPNWDSKRPLTSGDAFKPWEPKGGWPTKKKSPVDKKPTAKKPKEKEVEDDDEFDVEGDPVGSLQYIPTPEPEEDHSDSMMFLTNADIEKIYHADESLFEYIFKSSEAAKENPEGISFRYIAPQIRQKIEQQVQDVLNKG